MSMMVWSVVAMLFAGAQQPPQPIASACDGDLVVVRMSALNPGAMDQFKAAAQAHEDWYRKNGIKDNRIVVAGLVNRDASTGALAPSDTQVLSFHVRPPVRPANAGDESWKAYVKQYQDVSKIVSEHVACVPKGTFQ